MTLELLRRVLIFYQIRNHFLDGTYFHASNGDDSFSFRSVLSLPPKVFKTKFRRTLSVVATQLSCSRNEEILLY
jgi:hypothetical protein